MIHARLKTYRVYRLQIDEKILVGIIAALIIYAIIQSTLGLPTFYLGFLSNILIFGILGLGYNILHGHTGLVSLGHAGFYMTGAYAGAITLRLTENNIWLGFLFCLAITAAYAFIAGFVAVRLRGVYFILITLAFGMIPYLGIMRIKGVLLELSGGNMGFHLPYPPNFLFDLGNPLLFFFFALVVFLVVYIVVRRIINSSFGQCLKCIKDNELKLEGLGYNTRRLKYVAVTISGLFSGLAGYLYLLNNLSITPSLGSLYVAGKVIIVTLVGGANSIIGPILGSFIWNFVEQFLVVPGFLETTLGIALCIIILRLPYGITGLIRKK